MASAPFAVVGVGGLGCPALLGLVEAGARKLVLVDDDVVDPSNLQRQVLFGLADVGARKTAAASWSLRARAREPLAIDCVDERLQPDALDPLFDRLDPSTIVLECSDDPGLKFAIHDACFARRIPVVIGGVVAWRGQVMAVDPRTDRACYRCLFEDPPPRELAPACVAAGIVGAVAGALGHAMALLAVGLRLGADSAGALLHFDLLAGSVRRLAPARRRGCPTCASPQSVTTDQSSRSSGAESSFPSNLSAQPA